eukprot:CAMPEP_0172365134 /NCGR_PEP_ID=MMETSP1060-20121228/8111_1 /TAXON_ID=37318 /ORGANISM="Pseudo-nitzschia pungens, Strain cf. cingulata" /LENGTH=460 /DNA_ID=CAMNT_0013088333 /DNA_START=294 /DNA_END=1676 /DNA_ORIENTATION=+
MTSSSPTITGVNAFVAPPTTTTKPKLVEVDPSFSRTIQQQSSVMEPVTSIFLGLGLDKPFDDCPSVAVTEYTSSSISASTPITCAPEEHHFSLRRVLNVADTPYNPTAEELLLKFPKVVGHRGCLYLELENTREGFSRCHDMGCEAVELDVFKVRRRSGARSSSKDDTTLVVFHGGGTDENPGDLLDYCRIDGSILDYNYETEIREKLTFNPDYSEFPCPIEKIRDGEIPTLEEVLLDAKRKNSDPNQKKMHFKIELKGPDVVEDVLDLVDALGVADMCSYSSFDLQKLHLVRELRPGRCPMTGEYLYKTGALFNHIDACGKSLDDDYYAPPPTIGAGKNWGDFNIVERALAVGATEIHLKYDTCTKPLIDRIHAAGLGSMAWFRGPIGMGEDCSSKYFDVGNEDLAMYETVLRTGVQQLCVNKPDVLIELRERIFSDLQQQREEDLRQRGVLLGPSLFA